MSQELIDGWNMLEKVIKFIALYIMPISAFIASLIALKRSKDNVNVRLQLSEVEEKLNAYDLKLKGYELEKVENEKNKIKEAWVEARIIHISNTKYRLKIWNSGNATAYNVRVEIPPEYNIMIIGDKMPYEYLEPNNSFEENIIIYMGSSTKFKITTIWEDGENSDLTYTNEQLRSY